MRSFSSVMFWLAMELIKTCGTFFGRRFLIFLMGIFIQVVVEAVEEKEKIGVDGIEGAHDRMRCRVGLHCKR